ncbi:uncharacterized protein LOC126672781 [Mercurialis annua]|uniref:uncharacterized protein LOC126672781 n=1 Tax=Mercurialis annua TaxID=3986 RepID=UPI00215F806F|nr:uncharacterized protein LOC126672781 [Mercurialis annua]
MSLSINFISWNCRGGLSYPRKQRTIRSLISKHCLSVIGLIETKRELLDDFLISRLWPNCNYGYCFSPSVGASGGLLCIWDKTIFTPSRIVTFPRWISIDFEISSTPIRFILVYGCSMAIERVALWPNILSELQSDRLCFLVGDFNEILHPSDRLNCSGYSSGMMQFLDFIQSSSLVEINNQGRLFTWYNNQSRSKIDRCFLSPSGFITWPNMTLDALPRNFSDHTPLLFRSDTVVDWGPKPFKSINAWWM